MVDSVGVVVGVTESRRPPGVVMEEEVEESWHSGVGAMEA